MKTKTFFMHACPSCGKRARHSYRKVKDVPVMPRFGEYIMERRCPLCDFALTSKEHRRHYWVGSLDVSSPQYHFERVNDLWKREVQYRQTTASAWEKVK